MLARALQIWAFPVSDFIPSEKEFDSCTLDDENATVTGRDIIKYSYLNIEQPVSSWVDMFEHVVLLLHQKDRSILTELAYGDGSSSDLANYVSSKEDSLRSALRIDEGIFVEKNTSTPMPKSDSEVDFVEFVTGELHTRVQIPEHLMTRFRMLLKAGLPEVFADSCPTSE